MTVNILKMAVGIDSVEHLAARQRQRLEEARADGGPAELVHRTRHAPRRAREIVEGGGSIYWVVKGHIRARQRILRIEPAISAKGRRRCALVLDPELVPTELRPHRAFQGWRYLEAEDAPADQDVFPQGDAGLPYGLAEELRELGLL